MNTVAIPSSPPAYTPKCFGIELVIDATCKALNVRRKDIVGHDRHKSIAFARHVAMYVCRARLNASFPEIAAAFGGRDHTTVISACRKIEGFLSYQEEWTVLAVARVELELGAR